MDVLQDRPELQTVTRHQAHGALDGLQPPERGELIEQQQHRTRRLGGRPRQFIDCLRDQQAQPARIGIEPVGWQDQEYRSYAFLEIGKGKIGRRYDLGYAWAIEKMGVALCSRQHACCFAVRFADMAVGGARNQPARAIARLHHRQQRGEIIGRELGSTQQAQGALSIFQNRPFDFALGLFI